MKKPCTVCQHNAKLVTDCRLQFAVKSSKNSSGKDFWQVYYCVQLSRVHNNWSHVQRMLPTQESKLCQVRGTKCTILFVNLQQAKYFLINSSEKKIISLSAKNCEEISVLVFVLIIFVIVLMSFCQVFSFLFSFSLTICFFFANEINTDCNRCWLGPNMHFEQILCAEEFKRSSKAGGTFLTDLIQFCQIIVPIIKLHVPFQSVCVWGGGKNNPNLFST